jgi:hypothetical protein
MDSDRGMAPIILLGDFNEWRPTARLRPIDARLRRVPPRATWPARWPLLSLDRIWYGGDIALLGSQVVRRGHARVASDHLPLRAGFRLNPDPDPQHHPRKEHPTASSIAQPSASRSRLAIAKTDGITRP